MAKSCAICRKAMGANVKLFQAPLNEHRRQRWNESCGLILDNNSRICEKHFSRSDFINAPRDPMSIRTRLMPGAVPSLFCGNELREEENACIESEKEEKFPISHNEINEQATCEPLSMQTQRFRRDNIQSFCRTCLTFIAKHTVGHGLKINVHKTQDLAKWINECTQLKVEKNDGYPKYMCQECYHKLESFNEFRTTCIQSMHLLESVLGSHKNVVNDPIELGTATITTQICGDKCIPAKNWQRSVEDNFFNSTELLELENTNDDVPVEQEEIIDLAENDKLAEIKLDNNYITLDEDLHHSTKNSQQKFDCYETFNLKSCSDEILLEAIEFLETDCFSSEEIKFRSGNDDRSSKDGLLRVLNSKKQEQSHILTKSHSEKRAIKFKCELCQRCCSSEENLAAHISAHQDLNPFQRSKCDLSYSRTHRIISHKDNEQVSTCQFDSCEKPFQLVESLRSNYSKKPSIHQSMKLEPSLFICEVCGLTFKTNYQLNYHSFIHRPKEEYPYKCDKCGKCYVNKNNFKDHQMRHAGIKNFVCPYCGLKKFTRGELALHINYHTKTKQWPCRLCTRVFNNSGNLKKHDSLFHKGIRNYKCSHCGQCFGKSDTLKNHEMRHTGEKPHECKICGRRFIILSSLQVHMKKHGPKGEKALKPTDDVRNLKCSYCEKSFRTLNVLQNHELIHTGEKPHKCEICGKCFRQLSTLRYHQNWHERADGVRSSGIGTGPYKKKKPIHQGQVELEKLETDLTTLVTDVYVK